RRTLSGDVAGPAAILPPPAGHRPPNRHPSADGPASAAVVSPGVTMGGEEDVNMDDEQRGSGPIPPFWVSSRRRPWFVMRRAAHEPPPCHARSDGALSHGPAGRGGNDAAPER